MRRVTVDATVGAARAPDVFDAVLRWELPDPEGGSSWEWEPGGAGGTPAATSGVRPRWLDFRTGTLRWNEKITGYREHLRISFVLTDGDFAAFSGQWSLRQEAEDVALHFEADFDFGIESMAGILDPIAEEAVKETIGRAVTGMFAQAAIQT